MTKVLILAGTAEARALAARLADVVGVTAIASLAGVTSRPAAYPVDVRVGGFGGADGLRDWLIAERIGAVVDATHPFAVRMQENATLAAGAVGIPHLRLLRPAWNARPEWQVVPDLAAAACAVPTGARALLTAGRRDLGPFLHRTDVTWILRTIEPAPGLPPEILAVQQRPGASVAEEITVFRELRLTHLVAKNSGGPSSARLDAAEALRLGTIMVARPPVPDGDVVDNVEDAVAWITSRVTFTTWTRPGATSA